MTFASRIFAAAVCRTPFCHRRSRRRLRSQAAGFGSTDVYVSTGSGRIHVYPGSASELQVKAHVHAGWNAGGDIEDRIRRISANPPIAVRGNEIHIGDVPDDDRRLYNNITIDYEISAPAGVALNLRSGSGDVQVDNVGRYLKGETGSGSIRAHGIAGPVDLHTGSGSIELQQTAPGEVKATTGSGSIHINGLSGALTARTGSGNIEANGALSRALPSPVGLGIDSRPSCA